MISTSTTPASPVAAIPNRRRRGYIMLIEDDAGVREGLCEIIAEEGYSVICCSDGRMALRKHFEVDAKNIAYASLQALAEEGAIDKGTLKSALNKLGLDPNKLDPQKA